MAVTMHANDRVASHCGLDFFPRHVLSVGRSRAVVAGLLLTVGDVVFFDRAHCVTAATHDAPKQLVGTATS